MKQTTAKGRAILTAAMIAGCGLGAGVLAAQAPADTSQQQSAPASPTQKPKAPQDANPFPEDTNTVPVMPNATSPGTGGGTPPDAVNYGNVPLPGDASDPVRSPDDAEPATSDMGSGASSSSSGLDNLLRPPPDVEKQGRHHKNDDGDEEPVHHSGPKEDESVGGYYLETKNWRGALSRFESALVLDPENPEVYWGLAEAQRHLGDFTNAKANYQKLIDYDPDSRHGKEAKKLLKDPELANGPARSANAP